MINIKRNSPPSTSSRVQRGISSQEAPRQPMEIPRCTREDERVVNIKQAITLAIQKLELTTESARIDAEVLMAYALEKDRAYLYTYPDRVLTQSEHELFSTLITRREQGLPIAYLTHAREFWSLPLKVSEDTLIPRPETELLVELTLSKLKDKAHARVLDLGTGSGAIALALAYERKEWEIIACDKSEKALNIAKENAEKLGLHNITFYHSDWFAALPSLATFDAIVSNPPYLTADDKHLHEGDVRFEPREALVSELDGLADIEHIIKHSIARLAPGGVLLIEHGYAQKLSVEAVFKKYDYTDIMCIKDIQGLDRVSIGHS